MNSDGQMIKYTRCLKSCSLYIERSLFDIFSVRFYVPLVYSHKYLIYDTSEKVNEYRLFHRVGTKNVIK